jgi:hypothetical protein
MPPSSGEISFSYGATEVVIPAPEFGYTTEIRFPFDFTRLDDGTYVAYDEGSAYDKRQCRCSAWISPATQESLNALIIAARGNNLTLTLPSSSGFFPFGADKGDEGTFTVSLLLNSTPSIQLSPFKYFKCEMTIVNTGAYPSYALPSQVSEGVFYYGTVSYLRMPQNMFEPHQYYGVHVTFTENNTAKYLDRGSGADYTTTRYTQQCNESKCAALLEYISSQRTSQFTVTTSSSFYMFGADKGSTNSYTVKFASNMLSIVHHKYNEFELSIELQLVS